MRARPGTSVSERRLEHGAAAVEFALVVPLLVTLLFGMIQFGWFFFVANSASAAAREGARQIVVGNCWDSAQFLAYVKGQAPTTTSAVYSPTPLSALAVNVGDPVTVTVKADGAIINFIPMPNGGQVTKEFTARLEDKTNGVCS